MLLTAAALGHPGATMENAYVHGGQAPLTPAESFALSWPGGTGRFLQSVDEAVRVATAPSLQDECAHLTHLTMSGWKGYVGDVLREVVFESGPISQQRWLNKQRKVACPHPPEPCRALPSCRRLTDKSGPCVVVVTDAVAQVHFGVCCGGEELLDHAAVLRAELGGALRRGQQKHETHVV